ncbi:helix-turn-helix domain-containing protein [Paenibacillus sp. FSL L8-0463]|uniref:helix-turn-helix domain-containing protein n=1 Tax=Paenibacillus sp. FSL L8-0463 TaxID=2954687 RepID=UPI00311A443A
MELGKQLRRKRKELKLSSIQLAEFSGVSQSTISEIEADKRSPTINTLEKLCSAMHISLQEFFPYSEFSDFSKDEYELLAVYRKLSTAEKVDFTELLEIYHHLSPEEKFHFTKLFSLLIRNR